MIDVNKITSTLAKLPDAMLQKYAQLNKADPYIMALAMSESNRRKAVRSAGQGAQGMQVQPKVVDQGIAEMAAVDPMGNVTGYAGGGYLPEDQGIGRLPAGNMNFAGGGIIAFADGGDVERYQVGGALTGTTYADTMGFGVSPELLAMDEARVEEILARRKAAEDAERLKFLETAAPETAARLKAAQQPALPYNRATTPAAGYTRTDPRAAGADTFAESVKAVSAAPTADTTRKAPIAGLGAAAAAKAAPEQSVAQRYSAMQKEMGMGPESSADLDWRRSQLAERQRAQSKGDLEDFEKDVAARGEAFKGREERLAKREAGLGKMKDETTGLALLEAGLAIMSTPGGLATAIGKGAQAGLKTYGAGLEKLRSAQEKMDDARDQIEEFRRNEANMTAKERRQFKSAINKTETDIERLSLDAAEKMYGYKREDAKAVFTASTQERLTDKEIAARKELSAIDNAARERIAQLPQGNERIAMLLGGGDLAKGLAKFTEIQAGKFNPTTAYTDYISKRKEGDTVLTPQEFVTQIRSIQALMAGAPSVSNKPTGKAFE